jgi:hypothetical protein
VRSLLKTGVELGKSTTFNGELGEHLGGLLLDHGDVEEDSFVVRLDVHGLIGTIGWRTRAISRNGRTKMGKRK